MCVAYVRGVRRQVLGAAPSFLSKTYTMMQDMSHSDAVQWGRNGTTIIIANVRWSVCVPRACQVE